MKTKIQYFGVSEEKDKIPFFILVLAQQRSKHTCTLTWQSSHISPIVLPDTLPLNTNFDASSFVGHFLFLIERTTGFDSNGN